MCIKNIQEPLRSLQVMGKATFRLPNDHEVRWAAQNGDRDRTAARCWAEGGRSAPAILPGWPRCGQSQEGLMSCRLRPCQHGGLAWAPWCSLGRPERVGEDRPATWLGIGGGFWGRGVLRPQGMDLQPERVCAALALSLPVWNCPHLSQDLKWDRGRERQNLPFRQQNTRSAVSVVCLQLVPLRFCWVKNFSLLDLLSHRKEKKLWQR